MSNKVRLSFQVTAVVMHLGEIKFKQKSSKDDQAHPDGGSSGDKVAKLLGLETSLLYENFVKPRIKVIKQVLFLHRYQTERKYHFNFLIFFL